MNDSLRQISKKIHGRRFLFVFDNVWEGDENDWTQMLGALRFGFIGSKILVTSRNWTTDHLRADSCKIFPVSELPLEDCWAIFRDATLPKWSRADHQQEGLIKDRVLGLCNGLPFIASELMSRVCDHLVTSGLGSVNISEMKLWSQYEKGVAPFGRMWLDYTMMSQNMRRCVSFCATLPPNYVLDKKELIDLWMTQGLLQESGQVKDSVEFYHDDHLRSLASQSIFKDVEESEDLFGRKLTFKIHKLIHQFASFIGKEESVCQIVKNPGPEFPDVSHREELRSLVVQVSDSSPGDLLNPATLSKLLTHLIRLRSLAVSNCGVQNIPKIVSDLIHMRLLDVSRNRNLTELPQEICSLYNLETLSVNWCTELVNLPERMCQLVNLTNFYNYMTRAYLPRGVKQLSKLRRLLMFIVGDDEQEGMTSLDDLKGDRVVDNAMMSRDEELLSYLNPYQELEGLCVNGYYGTITLLWFDLLGSLRSIIFSDSPLWVELPALGHCSIWNL
ncbi:unnamed protein product [Linum trigynum]|uniref:NB-ARC domain-containing protein n=1 Tax=Linum trigynum TaxID=586398 RepID=A0AAV2EMH2_9ROSI